MEENQKLGLYVSYYLSRFNKVAYEKLGYGNMSNTHNKIGELLSVPPNTIRNWRDEFDPLFGHRAGWYQRPMTQSRLRVVKALEERGVSSDVLKSIGIGSQEATVAVTASDAERLKDRKVVVRAISGAEWDVMKKNDLPVSAKQTKKAPAKKK